ncbi:MAG: polysaccharide pyruvyl transferase family protein [Methyloversatilis sp.]|uniref:polysaccharide pyruvyl transferase family protein n=1 Tax=Methyloversatilis sp. TaxID=2569862 RepID=UPI00273374A8|nr:polysaccharide pyruvyl transferase family protein [Methyloversatilis sp.]MDP2867932.1 polysaccharide pyruvyl transferase family protein [Methyloversatilis sp.]
MPNIYFAGQDGFGNRGCEALIRSIVKTVRGSVDDALFMVPSRNGKADFRQWPGASAKGVEFVEAEPIPSAIRWWSRGRRLWSGLNTHPPQYRITRVTDDLIRRSDLLVMTGGDIISLDYGLESLYYWTRICEVAMLKGIPTALIGASVGPFSRDPKTEEKMRFFLSRFSLITVREKASLDYLHGLGLNDVHLVTDPAFALDPEEAPSESLHVFLKHPRVLGFNVSPLIRKFRGDSESKDALDNEVLDFLCDVLESEELGVVLVPHVDPLCGASENSDSSYMMGLLDRVRQRGFGSDRIDILPRSLNAAQLKDIIRRCGFFMGARTHATVAALSQLVPTTSIAYSVKAKGINQDLFGHTRYVLDTPDVTRQSLNAHFRRLKAESEEIVGVLADRIPGRVIDAARSAELIADLFRRQSLIGKRA